MKVAVGFREGRPAPDMTRDETVTWLLGSTGGQGVTAAFLTACLVTAAVDDLREGSPLEVETDAGFYLLSVTITGRWYRRTRTYHAEEIQ